MRPILGCAVACALALGALTGCAISETRQQHQREALTRRIVGDAIAYNEAYRSAITSQILINILRAYDRQPRQYTSMTGLAYSSPGTQQTTLGIGGLSLNQLGDDWGEGTIGLQGTRRVGPDYSVSPFGANDFANIALRPTASLVFQYYWDAGWNRDMILLLLVDRVRIGPVRGGGEPENLEQ